MLQTSQTPERFPDAEQERIDWARLLGQRVAGLQGGLIATAESCTGGLIAASFTETAGSSAWFSRGYVTYANQAKIDMLGVDAATLAAGGAVSEAVAIQMARGALRGADVLLSMAVTGMPAPMAARPTSRSAPSASAGACAGRPARTSRCCWPKPATSPVIAAPCASRRCCMPCSGPCSFWTSTRRSIRSLPERPGGCAPSGRPQRVRAGSEKPHTAPI